MSKLKLTSRILDKLGFSEYWDENGDYGTRTLMFSNGDKIRISDRDEKDDDTDGYAMDGRYIAQHFYYYTTSAYYDLYFLHELYECIKHEAPNSLSEFYELCESLKMSCYIDEYNSNTTT